MALENLLKCNIEKASSINDIAKIGVLRPPVLSSPNFRVFTVFNIERVLPKIVKQSPDARIKIFKKPPNTLLRKNDFAEIFLVLFIAQKLDCCERFIKFLFAFANM